MAAPPRSPAFLDITALAFCLIGLLGLISTVWVVKNGTVGLPRFFFLMFLAMTCAPFFVSLIRNPKLPFLIPPVVAIFLQYPIGAPHLVVYSTDPIFNYSFTAGVIRSGFWAPGVANAFARVYSFYPLGNVFEGYVIAAAGVEPMYAYNWIQPIIRTLAVPAIVYAIGRRLFVTRTAVLGLLFYMGTASILFNAPVQQENGTIFVGLSLLTLVILTQNVERTAKRSTQALFVLTAGGIVMTHHLSSYIFASWLASLMVLMVVPRFRPAGSSIRLSMLVLYFFVVLSLYIVTFTYQIFFTHEQTFERVISQFLTPEDFPVTPGAAGGGLGRTFSSIEIAWLAGSVIVLLLLALVTLRAFLRERQRPFVITNGLVASALVLTSLPLIVTSLNYVTLRISEFANFFIAPLAAATLVRWSRSKVPFRLPGLIRLAIRRRKWLPQAAAVLMSAAIFMGGNLAPLFNMRVYFETPESRTTDSPVFFGSDALRVADWGQGHFAKGRVWGDQLAVDAFAGFADMRVDFGSERIFSGDTLDATAWSRLAVGDYVAVDSLMVTHRTSFFQEPARVTPLTPSEVGKFAQDHRHFALVYQDGLFSIYRVISKP